MLYDMPCHGIHLPAMTIAMMTCTAPPAAAPPARAVQLQCRAPPCPPAQLQSSYELHIELLPLSNADFVHRLEIATRAGPQNSMHLGIDAADAASANTTSVQRIGFSHTIHRGAAANPGHRSCA